MANSLVIEKIDAAYGAVRVLEDVSLRVDGGETVVLLGTNGNGKSTLMKCVMGILPPRAGRITAEIDGEQQMLALARALMLAPRIILIDEPSVGLAPVLVSRTIDKIKELKDTYKLTVLMAEQNFPQALRIADRGYVIVHGQIAFEGRSSAELNNNDLIRKFYLGL